MKSPKRKNLSLTKISLITLVIAVLILLGAWNSNSHLVKEDHPHMMKIEKTPASQREARDKLIALLDKEDPNSIFKVIDTIQNDPVLSRNCHEIAHDIGHESFELYGFAEAMTFNNPNHVKHALPQYICAGGYMHGILEQLSLHKPEFLKEPEVICDLVPDADRPSCFHGVGHVFMMNYGQNVPKSILGCRVIKLNNDMYRCFEGVRMEQFWGNIEYTSTSTLGWDTEKPLDTCIAAKTDERPTCFLYSTFGYLRFHPKEYKAAAQLCATSGLSSTDDHFCLKGLGMTMMSKFKGQNLAGSEQYVEGLTLEQKYAFYKGVIGYSMLSGIKKDELGRTCAELKNDSLVCEEALAEVES